jgi:hypothetical protein
MTTPADALDYLIASIAAAPDDVLLTDTLTRLAVACTRHPKSAELLETFVREFYLERGRLRLMEAIAEAIEKC